MQLNNLFILFLQIFLILFLSFEQIKVRWEISLLYGNKDKINNEYYMDTVAKYALKLKYKTKYILVKNFKSFGTPRQLKQK